MQTALLEEVERVWDSCNVIAINAPTALGKTDIAYALAKFAGKAAILTPSRVLVEQYVADFPRLPHLKAKGDYICPDCSALGANNCYEAARLRGSSKRPIYSPTCEYPSAMRKIRVVPYFLCNYHVYMAHKLNRPTVILDEAHNTIPFIQDLAGMKIWQHKERFPHGIKTSAELLGWIERQPVVSSVLEAAATILRSPTPTHIVEPFTDEYGHRNSEGVRRVADGIRLRPIDIRSEPSFLWNSGSKKIILLSATIGQRDLRDLGLSAERGYRCAYMEADSPIPADRRPIIYRPIANVSYKGQEEAIPKIARAIQEIEEAHLDESGVVHLTYGLAKKLREYLRSQGRDEPHYIWHTSDTRGDAYQRFLTSPPGTVLFASGLYEGIDLKGDLARWQILCKIPWPSLTDAAIQYKVDTDEEWYANQTIKTVMQFAGRVCRTPTDYGTSYILDTSWERLRKSAAHLMPRWFTLAIKDEV